MRRTLAVVALAALVVLFPASALSAGQPPDDSGGAVTPTTIDNSFLDTERDLSDCLNNSIELPGCGRAPATEGDRGGALQLATFVIMGVGLTIIGWRIARAIRARDAALGSRTT